MPGKNFIKIPSIFMAVSGVISIVLYLVIDLILACGTIDTGEPLGWMVVAIAVIYAVFAVLEFHAAAIGIKYCGCAEKAAFLKKKGFLLILASLIAGASNTIFAILQGDPAIPALTSAVLGLFFPLLYTYGASLNEKAGQY